MNPERWGRIERLYHEALEREPKDRDKFLVEACEGDTELRGELDSLLAHAKTGETFLEKAALEFSGPVLVDADALPFGFRANVFMPGAELGPYRIEKHLGSGGMGEVYLARDTRLDRMVAIKVLPPLYSLDRQFRERFEREARAVSRLNHEHICRLYDVGRQGGIDYLVMEYLEGETLASRLTKGALPLDQALRFGIEIASALHEAHRHGVIHRDIKPENILLTKSGAKVLDFGIAKMRQDATTDLTIIPTGLTEEGTILGTLQYMAPEQLEGKQVDTRTDIFALGAVLYEMITGKPAFSGASRASLMASILDHDPAPLTHVDRLMPPALDWAVRKCLAKDPDKRWQSAQDLEDELKWIREAGYEATTRIGTATRSTKRQYLPWAIALLSLAGLAVMSAVHFRQRAAEPEIVAFTITPPANTTFDGPMAISPDGRQLVLVASGSDGVPYLWVRRLDSPDLRSLPGTQYASDPFWSPDSRFIAFFSNGELNKIEASGGSVQTLCDAPGGLRGTWNRDGVILFAQAGNGGLYRVSAEGGRTSLVRRPDRSHSETSYRWPQFLADGQHFLYTALTGDPQKEAIYVSDLGSQQSKLVVNNSWIAYYSAGVGHHFGYLFFFQDFKLKAQRFDPKYLSVSGKPIPVAEAIGCDWRREDAFFSVSESGTVVYRPGPDPVSVSLAPWLSGARSQLVWYNRSGKQLRTVDALGQGVFPRLSPDGQRLALSSLDPQTGNFAIWLLQLAHDATSRVTPPMAGGFSAVWSPDGSRIVFASARNGIADLYERSPTGEGNEQLILQTSQGKWPWDWSRDGRFISFTSDSIQTKTDLWILPLGGERKPLLFRQTPANELGGMFSPDQKWIAYSSDESGRWEVYVESFNLSQLDQKAPSRRRWQVSSHGGFQPLWRRDGKELFYISSDVSPRDWWTQGRPGGRLMAVDVKLGPQFTTGVPRELFRARFPDQAAPITYAATADGQRFLINTLVAVETPVTVLLNWQPPR